MADMDLNDDMAKVVRWTVVSLDRFGGGENVLAYGEQLVTENLSADDYKVRVAVKYAHEHSGLLDGVRKNLRVTYEVLARFEREPLRFDENSLKSFQDIAKNLATMSTIGDRIDRIGDRIG